MMNAIKRHLCFSLWIACCVVWIVVGLFWLQRLWQSARHEGTVLARKIQQRGQLLPLARSPEPEEVACPVMDLTAVPATVSAGAIPRKPLEAFIEIARVREDLRRLAASQEVALAPDEAFGLGAYAHHGPPENQLTQVHQQLGLIQLLLGKLFVVRPDRLLAVRREVPPATERDSSQKTEVDFFQMDRRLDQRVPGLISGQAIRLEFTGQTPVLRAFLNALADAPESLLVRCVEVEPSPPGTKTLVGRSRFSVVVEQVQPVSSLAKGGSVAGQSPPSLQWAKLPVQPAGAGPTVELFASFDFTLPEAGRVFVTREMPVAGENQSSPGIELLAVKRAPYRLQLVGYFGSPGEYTAAFVRPDLPGTLLARVGHHFESLGLTLKSFSVEKLAMESPAGFPGYEMAACAQLWDEQKQEQVLLVSRERRLTDIPVAMLRVDPQPAQPREFRTGETIQDGSALWRIERIQLDPAEIMLVEQTPGLSAPGQRVLHLLGQHAEPILLPQVAASHGP